MSDDVGGVPTPGNVSDPTGNTAVRLMRTMHDVDRELRYSVTQMEKVKRFIRNSSGINHDDGLCPYYGTRFCEESRQKVEKSTPDMVNASPHYTQKQQEVADGNG